MPGLFRVFVWLDWGDAVAEFAGQGWLGVACEEVSVEYFAQGCHPVA